MRPAEERDAPPIEGRAVTATAVPQPLQRVARAGEIYVRGVDDAEEGLGADGPPGAEIDDGLVVEPQAVGVEGQAQRFGDRGAGRGGVGPDGDLVAVERRGGSSIGKTSSRK